MITNNNILLLRKTKENTHSLHLCCRIVIALSTVCISNSIVSGESLPEDANIVNTSAYDAGDKDTSPLENDLLITSIPITDISRKLWKDRITYLKNTDSDTSSDEIETLIDQIKSIEFGLQNQIQEPIVTLEPIKKDKHAIKAQSNETEPVTLATQTPEPVKPEHTISQNRLQSIQIKEQTLQIFKDMSQKPEQLQNPFELAEILFNGNCLTEAAKCYRQALDRISADDTDQHSGKAWLLFQLGNCLQNDDPQTAMQTYKQLTQEYPDSSWADLANAKALLIDWYQKNKPDALINKPKLQASLSRTEYQKGE